MKLEQAKAALEGHQNAFNDLAKQPNTLQRNVDLAEHRAEIGRLQKLIAKPSTTAGALASATAARRQTQRSMRVVAPSGN